MLLFRIKMFFTSAVYRKCTICEIKNWLIYYFTLPLAIASDIYDTVKLYMKYPNKWERYEEIKTMKKKEQEERRKKEAVEACESLKNTIFCLNIGWISYCSFKQRQDIKPEEYQKLFDEFEKNKKNFAVYVSRLVWRGVSIPKELVTLVEETKIDKFSTMEEYEEFSKKLDKLIHNIYIDI